MIIDTCKNIVPCTPKLSGISIAISEIFLYFIGTTLSYLYIPSLNKVDAISFYWCSFTILTGIWEMSFVSNYNNVRDQGNYLLSTKTRVWRSKYNLSYILPWKLAIIFYGEYAAYADREYMSIKDKWSRLIESTHAFFCASFSLISVILYMFNECERAEITWTIAMGSQLMNSILYMGQYIVQTNDIYSPNYNSDEFPCGFLFCKRPFMYINIFWSLMPAYAIIRLLC